MKIELTVQELKELTKTPVAGTTDVITIRFKEPSEKLKDIISETLATDDMHKVD